MAMTSEEDEAGFHISKSSGDDFRLSFQTADGALVFTTCVPDRSLSDAHRKSEAIGKLRKNLDKLHEVIKDDNAPPP